MLQRGTIVATFQLNCFLNMETKNRALLLFLAVWERRALWQHHCLGGLEPKPDVPKDPTFIAITSFQR